MVIICFSLSLSLKVSLGTLFVAAINPEKASFLCPDCRKKSDLSIFNEARMIWVN